MTRVLFVCLHSAGRSQMSEALFNRAAAGCHEGRSAGSTPAEHVHPEVIAVMDGLGLDLRAEKPKLLTREHAEWADVVVTMGCGDACPSSPARAIWTGSWTTPRAGPSTPSAPRATRSRGAPRRWWPSWTSEPQPVSRDVPYYAFAVLLLRAHPGRDAQDDESPADAELSANGRDWFDYPAPIDVSALRCAGAEHNAPVLRDRVRKAATTPAAFRGPRHWQPGIAEAFEVQRDRLAVRALPLLVVALRTDELPARATQRPADPAKLLDHPATLRPPPDDRVRTCVR